MLLKNLNMDNICVRFLQMSEGGYGGKGGMKRARSQRSESESDDEIIYVCATSGCKNRIQMDQKYCEDCESLCQALEASKQLAQAQGIAVEAAGPGEGSSSRRRIVVETNFEKAANEVNSKLPPNVDWRKSNENDLEGRESMKLTALGLFEAIGDVRAKAIADKQAKLDAEDAKREAERKLKEIKDQLDCANSCSICLQMITENRKLKRLHPCGHMFCAECIDKTLSRLNPCPQCKKPITQADEVFPANVIIRSTPLCEEKGCCRPIQNAVESHCCEDCFQTSGKKHDEDCDARAQAYKKGYTPQREVSSASGGVGQ